MKNKSTAVDGTDMRRDTLAHSTNESTAANNDMEMDRIRNRNELQYTNGNIDHIPLPVMNVQAMVVPSYAVVLDAQPYQSIIGVEGEEIHSVDTINNNDDNGDITRGDPQQRDEEQQRKVKWWNQRTCQVSIVIAIVVICVVVVVGIIVYVLLTRNPSIDPTPNNNVPTLSPTFFYTKLSPTLFSTLLSKTEVMTTYINRITVSGRNISINGVTSEDLALRWMINDDPFFNDTESWLPIATLNETSTMSTNINSSNIITTIEQFRFIQRYALLTMWFQQVDTNGTFQRTWNIIDKWLVDRNECNWYGIQCSIIDIGENIGEVGAVTEIIFDLNNITGTISPDLGLLSMIQHVVFSSIKKDTDESDYGLIGTLPTTIGLWTSLSYFDIGGNSLEGSLPSVALGQWVLLEFFNVAYCKLNGTIPSTIGQWMALKYFDISFNKDLTGQLPVTSIEQWTALTYIGIAGIGFTGTIPIPAIGQWTALTYFDASVNALQGTLPSTEFAQWTALTYFDVSSNAITGTLPSIAIGQWTALKYFDIGNNKIRGTLPSTAIGMWTTLTYLDIAGNALTGTIPTSVGNWDPFLDGSAYFQYNNLIGTMPMEMCHLLYKHLEADCTINCTCCTAKCV